VCLREVIGEFVEQNVESKDSTNPMNEGWPGSRVYGMAAICLCAGLLGGWVVRGPQRPKMQTVGTETTATQSAGNEKLAHGMPTEDHMQRMAEKKVAPLLEQLKAQPNDPALLAQIAKVYVAGQQLPQAISYYERAVEADPKQVGNRADLASYLYLTGETDKAIQQLEKAQTYEPSNPQVLFNLGSMRLKAKGDKAGAIQAWTQLLKTNKNLPEGPKHQVEQAIARAKAPAKVAGN
jgi:cytochrome c-type biogenesis protein CcmH/NrfG